MKTVNFYFVRIFFTAVILCYGALATQAQVAIDETNFPDANFRECVERYDTDKDGFFSSAELEAVKYIGCAASNIASLKGIEYFTALESLWCQVNNLTSLDVSKNTALTEFACYNNKLTSLNVGNKPALVELDCGVNQLTSVDVSECPALVKLECEMNCLTSIDVSKNTALTELGCFYNKLTSLDVSNNPDLVKLNCSVNQLTSVDVSENTALTELECSRNQLTSLDVNKNTSLKSLDCTNNQITTLNVKDVPAIKDCVENGTKDEYFSNGYIYKSSRGELMVDRNVKIITEEESTGIDAISYSPSSTGVWYTLNGVRIVGEPTQPGVYIQDGKKVVLK